VFCNNTVIYLVNNTTYISNQYYKFSDMFRFNRTIIRPNTKHSIGTFNKCLHCGVLYCLQLYWHYRSFCFLFISVFIFKYMR